MDTDKKIDIEYKIIQTSFGLFLENGYENTTIRQIAKESGIGRGHLYYYFKKKEDILLYIYKKILDRIYKVIDTHNQNDTELLLNYAITQCLYTYTIIGHDKLFRIYIEASKVPVIRKEYVDILIDLFTQKSFETNYKVSEKDIYLSVAMGCAGEEELLRRYYNKDINLEIDDIIKAVLSTRLILLNIIDRKEVNSIVDKAVKVASKLNIDDFLENFNMYFRKH